MFKRLLSKFESGLILTLVALAVALAASPKAQAQYNEPAPRIENSPFERHAQVAEEIFRGPLPKTKEDFEYLRSLGIKTIISLNLQSWVNEIEERRATRFGINVIKAPLMAGPIPPKKKSLKRVLNLLKDESLYPIYIHCKYGKDRTGLIIALHRIYNQGWTTEDAQREMEAFEFSYGIHLYGLRHAFREYTQKPLLP